MIAALILYNVALLLLSPLAVIVIIWRLFHKGKSRRGLGERLGLIPARKLGLGQPRIWLHAVSVGETVAAKPIWTALLRALPGWQLYHSTITDTGQAEAAKVVGDFGQVIYFPFDFLLCVWLSLARVRPRLIVLVETELWPNFLAVARLLGIKVMIANGRISDRTLRGAARSPILFRWMTSNVDRFCMQSREDADRIVQLGAAPERVTVVGNSKFDQALGQASLGEQVTLRNALGLTRSEPAVIAGSTHPGEEEIVLRAFRQLKTANPEVRLIIAPRDIHRAQEVEELAAAHGFLAARRTRLATMPAPPDAVIILDTIGELARAYALCAAAFVGGSLVPHGGHNVLEPLALGKPALFGPHMGNFRDIALIVKKAGAGFEVADDAELAARWLEFLAKPSLRRKAGERVAAMFEEHQGASARCAAEAQRLTGVSPAEPDPMTPASPQ